MSQFDLYALVAFISFLILMGVVESLSPFRHWIYKRMQRIRVHATLALLNTILIWALFGGGLAALSLWTQQTQWGLLPNLNLSDWQKMGIGIILLDSFNYWWHRWNHRIPLLWRFHKVHHIDIEVDVTTSLRFHPGEFILSFFVKCGWILIIGPTVITFILFEALVSMNAQFHHSNIDLPESIENFLRKFIVTPRFHAFHHALKAPTRNHNFSSIFTIWDKIFGTYSILPPDQRLELGIEELREAPLSLSKNLKAPFTSIQ